MPNDVKKSRTFASTMSSDGVEYRLYDNVRVFEEQYKEPHVGKIWKLWKEEESGSKKALIRWFLRHKEVNPKADGNSKELFLAFGKGKGVTNENDLDVIVGKCKVLCTSKDRRNKQPSVTDIENSDFFFSHIYNVDAHRISPVERVADKLGIDAVFNKEEWVTVDTKIQDNTYAAQANQDSDQECIPGPKKRPRDEETAANSLMKMSQLAVLRKRQASFDKSPKSKRVKVVDGTALPPKENLQKAALVEEPHSENEMACTDGLSSGDALPHRTSEGICVSHGEVERAHKHVPELIKAVDSGKASVPGDAVLRDVPMVDAPDQHACVELSEVKMSTAPERMECGLDEKDQIQPSSIALEDYTQMLEQADEMKMEEGDWVSKKEKSDGKESARAPQESKQEEVEVGLLCELSTSAMEALSLKKQSSKPLLELKGTSIEAPIKEIKLDAMKKNTEKKLMSTGEIGDEIGKRKLFKELSWEETLQRGIPFGRVLLLQNLDPLVTTEDMRDVLKNAFQGLSDARVLPQETQCPYGKALIIFESRSLADSALEAMEMDCFVMNNKRTIIASRVKESTSQAKFPGHLAFDKVKVGRNLISEDYKKALCTSHSSQPNTIEYEMAMEWRVLQEITQTCREELFKRQRREMNNIRISGGKTKAQRPTKENPR